MTRRFLLSLFAALILLLNTGAYPLFAADKSRKMGVEMKLLGTGSDFIVANEKKFMITPKTRILDKNGQNKSLTQLSQDAKIYIEYKAYANKTPVATLIKVISVPRRTTY